MSSGSHLSPEGSDPLRAVSLSKESLEKMTDQELITFAEEEVGLYLPLDAKRAVLLAKLYRLALLE